MDSSLSSFFCEPLVSMVQIFHYCNFLAYHLGMLFEYIVSTALAYSLVLLYQSDHAVSLVSQSRYFSLGALCFRLFFLSNSKGSFLTTRSFV